MSVKSMTVADLARSKDLDVESVLVALWDAGLSNVDSGASRVSGHELRKVAPLLDLDGAHQRKVSYWLDHLELSREEFAELLGGLGVGLDPRSNTLPKGATKRLRSFVSASRTKVEESKIDPELPVVPPPDFSVTTTSSPITYLTVSEVRAIHDALEEDFALSDDPIYPIGVRNQGLLEGAVERHATQFHGQLKYPTISLPGAALLHGLVHNHPFYNGNKRTALVALLVFLDRNGRVVVSEESELFRWMLQIAAHGLLDPSRTYEAKSDHELLAISQWIERHTRRIAKEERSVQWRVLKNVLRSHGCEISRDRGEKERISRVVVEKVGKGIFRRSQSKTLTSYYVNTGDGREVPKTQIKRIRQELFLDEQHGIDSEQFYAPEREVDYFIVEYSKTLRRLARV